MGIGTLVRGAVGGAVAGATGTLAMDLVWYLRYRREGGEDAFPEWEWSSSIDTFEGAPAPAEVGRRVAARLGVTLPDEAAAVTNNVVHWATGIQWGAGYGAVAATVGRSHPLLGLVLGPVAWGTSYAVLAPAGIYRPIWEYDRTTLWKDLSAHLVFGVATATVVHLFRRRR